MQFMTSYKDKLIVLLALARQIGDNYGMVYLAGVWRKKLGAQLLWRLWKDPFKRPIEYCVPSWSCASVEG